MSATYKSNSLMRRMPPSPALAPKGWARSHVSARRPPSRMPRTTRQASEYDTYRSEWMTASEPGTDLKENEMARLGTPQRFRVGREGKKIRNVQIAPSRIITPLRGELR